MQNYRLRSSAVEEIVKTIRSCLYFIPAFAENYFEILFMMV